MFPALGQQAELQRVLRDDEQKEETVNLRQPGGEMVDQQMHYCHIVGLRESFDLQNQLLIELKTKVISGPVRVLDISELIQADTHSSWLPLFFVHFFNGSL